MAVTDMYPCYVKIGEDELCQETVELPTEKDGTLLLSTVQAQFPHAIGLRFKSDTGGWRGVRLVNNVLDPPLEGWGNSDYIITLPKQGGKRKLDDSEGPDNKVTRTMTEAEMLSDLIVLGLPYAATEDDLKTYFEKFGELDYHEIKYDKLTKKSKGFGFIRYKDINSVKAMLNVDHVIQSRRVEVRYPKKENDAPTKVFVGRLPRGTTSEDLREHFSKYGELKDVYIPSPFRSFGFVTFGTPEVARQVLYATHIIKGTTANVSYPDPKGQKAANMYANPNMSSQYGYGGMQGSMHMQGNMYGNMQGSVPGNMPGGMSGNMQGPMQGNMQGNMQGHMQGNMQGQMQGNMQGHMQGNMQGHMQGNMQGNIPGNIQGNMQGNRPGNIPPNVQGNMQGNMPMQQMQAPQQQYGPPTGYGNQSKTANPGFYTSGYFQSGGKIHGGSLLEAPGPQ